MTSRALSLLLSLVAGLTATLAPAGVNQGNPRMTFHNMKNNFRVTYDRPWMITPTDDFATLRVDVAIKYRRLGYFVIGQSAGAIPEGFSLCAQKPVAKTTVAIFWIGKDCHHQYFKQTFDELSDSAHYAQYHN